MGAHVDGTANQRSFVGLIWALCAGITVVRLCLLVGLLAKGMGSVSDPLTWFLHPFPPYQIASFSFNGRGSM